MLRTMLESLPAYSGFATGVDGRAYNEAAFRHFLAIERRRAETSTQSLLLILVKARQDTGGTARLSAEIAAAVFRGLGDSVREVDFVGWFQEGRVAGAVLAQGTMPASVTARHLMTERVIRTLRKQLPRTELQQLRVRVLHLVSHRAASQPVARAL